MLFQVRVSNSLVNQHSIAEKNIIILSQYRAQCHKLNEKLRERGLRDVNVSTVVASQGRSHNIDLRYQRSHAIRGYSYFV